MSLAETERLSLDEAEKLGVKRLVGGARDGHSYFISGDDQPVAVVVPFKDYKDFEELADEAFDLLLFAARRLGDSGGRTPLDEVIERLGFTREEIEAADD